MELNDVDFELLWKTWNTNPKHQVFTKLQNNLKQSYYFAKYLINNNKQVPEIIIQGIAKDSYWSYYFAIDLIETDKQVPEMFLQSIAKDSEWSYYFAEYLIKTNKQVPEIIIQSIAKDSEWSYYFATYLIMNNKEVPEIIKKTANLKENVFKKLNGNLFILKEAPHIDNQICPYCGVYFNFDPKIENWTNESKKNRAYLKFYTLFFKKFPCKCPNCDQTVIYDYNLSGHNKTRKPETLENEELYIVIAKKKMRFGSSKEKFDSDIIRKDSSSFKSFAGF